jgi:ATP-dependent Zn protease
MTTDTDFLRANAYHEAGHAIVGWALDLCVHEIAIRDDAPGHHTKTNGDERLPLIDLVALSNAGGQAEEVFEHLLPSWASTCDRVDTLNLLATNDIRDTAEAEKWIANGCARARELLRKHERRVHLLAARLIECRRMSADEFECFMRERDAGH